MEIEYKLSADINLSFDELLCDQRLESLASSAVEKREHSSVYFDTADGYLDNCGITLRLRTEKSEKKDELVCCLKKKPDVESKNYKIREEYECVIPKERITDDIYENLPAFCIDDLEKAGVPRETAEEIRKLKLCPSAKVTYTRIAKLIRVSSDTLCELALDEGIFASGERFKEVELELIRGNVEEIQIIAMYLMRKYKMKIQPLSKRARAKI